MHKEAKSTSVCIHECIQGKFYVVFVTVNFLLYIMDLLAASLATNSITTIIGAMSLGAALNRVAPNDMPNGKAPPAPCPAKTQTCANSVSVACFVPSSLPNVVGNGGKAQDDFLEFLEGLKTPKWLPSPSKKRTLELAREV